MGFGTLGRFGGIAPPPPPIPATPLAAVGVELTGKDGVDAGTLAPGAGLGKLFGVTEGGIPAGVRSIPRAVAVAAPPAAAPVGVVSMSEPARLGMAAAGVGTPIPVGPSNLVVNDVAPLSPTTIFSVPMPCAGAGLGAGAAGGGVGAGTGLPTPLPLFSRLQGRLGRLGPNRLDAAAVPVAVAGLTPRCCLEAG